MIIKNINDLIYHTEEWKHPIVKALGNPVVAARNKLKFRRPVINKIKQVIQIKRLP
jgi:hypothetical protein